MKRVSRCRIRPAQRRWLHEEFFTAIFSIPWFMGLTHGVGFGGLGGAMLALVPSVGSSVTAGAIYGALAGAVTATSLSAVFFALLPSPKDTLPAAWSLKQRMLLIVSPLLAVPALIEAAALWWRWYAQGPSGTRTLGDV